MRIAQIIPAANMPRKQDSVFSYGIPEAMQGKIRPGMIVEIPLRKQAVPGVVAAVTDELPDFPVRPIIRVLWEAPVFTPQLLALARFISDYYLASLGLVVKLAITRPARRAHLMARAAAAPSAAPHLTDEQENAVRTVLAEKKAQTYLLHGVTGSGKTEVYLHAAEQKIREGKQVLILVPEIALTPQTLARFSARFDPKSVAVVHSKLSYGQKYLIWKGAYEGTIKVIIGPRSALFAPFTSLGLIVMDEEHESSFKQFDQNPKFHSRTVAEKLSQLWNCPLVLGDATPSVETYYAAETGRIKKLELTHRIYQEMPPVQLVDMREETRAGNFTIYSRILLEEMREALGKKQQVILFINRRGTATSVQCSDCGNLMMCTRCTVPLVYHRDRQDLECHHCQRTYPIPASCPVCGSVKLKFFGTGTEKVETTIRELYPQARVKRLDRDAVSSKSELEALYEDFISKKFDILVGTQMIAKGWDLASVGLIGVVNADTILSFPDFHSNERTFQLATQVAGRTGRGQFPGRVVLQTYNPDNFAIRAAVKHDYRAFYEREIADRREFGYPPFTRLVKLTLEHTKQEKLLQMTQDLIDLIKQKTGIPHESVIGQSPAFIPRVRGRYGVYVILKLPPVTGDRSVPETLARFLSSLHPGWDIDIDPDTIL